MKKKLLLILVVLTIKIYSQPLLPSIETFENELKMPDTTGYIVKTVGPSSFNDYKKLQDAINNSQYGTILKLEAGAFFKEDTTICNSCNLDHIFLPQKNNLNDKWIIIMGAKNELIAKDCERIQPNAPTGNINYPTQKDAMPKIITDNYAAAILTDYGANHYRFVGIEVCAPTEQKAIGTYGLVHVTLPYANYYPALAQQPNLVPNHIIFDRCYIHGNDTSNNVHGVVLDGNYVAIVNSEISNIRSRGQESHGILQVNSVGPLVINNNFIEAAGINILFGGGVPVIAGTVPRNIIIKQNHLSKKLKWRWDSPNYDGQSNCVKNLFEIKNASIVLLEGNILENSWADCLGQKGWAVALRSMYGAVGQADDSTQCNNVTVRNNIIRNCAMGFCFDGYFTTLPPLEKCILNNILVENNLLYEITVDWYNAASGNVTEGFVMNGHPSWNVTLNHNTVYHNGYGGIMWSEKEMNKNFIFTNNICFINENAHSPFPGFSGNSYAGGIGTTGMLTSNPVDTASILNWYYGPVSTLANRFKCNIFVNPQNLKINDFSVPTSIHYPAGNFFPANLTAVGFVDTLPNDYHNYALKPGSQYKNSGCDGKDVGADIKAIDMAMTTGINNCVATGIKTHSAENALTIYPNPTHDFAELNYANYKTPLPLIVFDALGNEVISEVISSAKYYLKTANLDSGIYYVKIGNTVKKLIIN